MMNLVLISLDRMTKSMLGHSYYNYLNIINIVDIKM